MTEIRYATEDDTEFWFTLDRHISRDEFKRKIRDKAAYIVSENGVRVGILRYNLFWDSIPFCTMLYLESGSRGRGIGRELMKRWEADMKENGHGMVMTSTQVDEQAQFFYRKLGYRDAGGLLLDIPGYEQPMEMFMIKAL